MKLLQLTVAQLQQSALLFVTNFHKLVDGFVIPVLRDRVYKR
jgi:hypothetical protein